MANTLTTLRPVTHEPGYHWFGYYDMPCWDCSGRWLLSLEASFDRRPPTALDVARIGLTDLESGEYRVIGETRAFNWQQGAMLRWQGPPGSQRIIYNDRRDGRLVAVMLDPKTGCEQVLCRATSDVGAGGRYALGLNFARLADTRPGYGYAGVSDPFAEQGIPEDDGLWVTDLAMGEEHLVVSMWDVYQYLGEPPQMADVKMWFNHTLLNPSETRIAFLVRWRPTQGSVWTTRMFTVSPDGDDLRLVLGDGMVSHFDWRNDRELLAWARIAGRGDHFYLFDEQTLDYRIVGDGILTEDGHCSYAHNGRWILTDTYPDPVTRKSKLSIYLPEEHREVVLGWFVSPAAYTGELRCDLHPRWSPDDRTICIDSVHEGHRQIYLLETPAL